MELRPAVGGRRGEHRGGAAVGDEIRRDGGDILVIGRTDCRLATNVADGFAEALWRCAAFEEMGADVVYFEAPQSEREMETFNARRAGTARSLLAQVERVTEHSGAVLTAAQCGALGYDATLFGLTLLSASAAAMDSPASPVETAG